MFDLFKKKSTPAEPDVKSIRDSLLQFIRKTLAKAEGGEGGGVKAVQLFLACSEGEKHLYEAAVYFNQEGRFKEDIQRIADDFALQLPPNWELNLVFTQQLPVEAIQATELPVAIFIQTGKNNIQKTATAYLKVLTGEAEKESYTITSESGKINMGREKKVQRHDNFFRINTIAFPAESANESNKFISRQHAHIEWDNATGSFLLFADEGGVPPCNKVKVRPQQGGDAVKLQSTRAGYSLQDGDQIMLGETALLEFRFSPD